MKTRILTFDGNRLGSETLETPGRLRWACWDRRGGSALIVGDAGTLLESRGDRFVGIRTGTTRNIRCAEFSPDGGVAWACGNAGLALSIQGGEVRQLEEHMRENLRRVAWDPSGNGALFVGNNGAAYFASPSGLRTVHGADTNLRSIAWHSSRGFALVTGNCFRESLGGLSPSPNLFRFTGAELDHETTLAESRADIVASSWRPDRSSCLLAGFDQTWHNPLLFSYEDGQLKAISWEAKSVFPTACAWHPSGEYALIGTSTLTDEEGSATLYRFDGKAVQKLSDLKGSGVSCIAWSPDAVALVIASRATRAYSA